jgi:hypothetical protein
LRATAAVVTATGLAALIGVLAAGRGLAGLAIALGLLVVGCLAALGSADVRATLLRLLHSVRKEVQS